MILLKNRIKVINSIKNVIQKKAAASHKGKPLLLFL